MVHWLRRNKLELKGKIIHVILIWAIGFMLKFGEKARRKGKKRKIEVGRPRKRIEGVWGNQTRI